VVGVLVVGIAISVVEYLESSRPAPLAQEPARDPALIEVGASTRAPTERANRPRSLVRASRNGMPAATPARGTSEQPIPGIGVEPSSAGAAPMALQPDGDG
jgi:hypothetical protein